MTKAILVPQAQLGLQAQQAHKALPDRLVLQALQAQTAQWQDQPAQLGLLAQPALRVLIVPLLAQQVQQGQREALVRLAQQGRLAQLDPLVQIAR